MDKDRWSYLAVRAYARGLLTLSQQEQIDDRWQLREEILLAEVERESLAKLHEMVHLAETSAAQYVDQNVFDHHYKAARKQYHAFSKLMYPFGTDDRPIDQQTFDTLRDAWLREFGDPDGEAVKRTIAYLQTLKVE